MRQIEWTRVGLVASVAWIVFIAAFAAVEYWGNDFFPSDTAYFVEWMPDSQVREVAGANRGETLRLAPMLSPELDVVAMLQVAFFPLVVLWAAGAGALVLIRLALRGSRESSEG